MSEENLELVREFYAGGRYDWDPGMILGQFAAPDIEYVNPPEAVEPGVRRGLAEVAQAMHNSSELFDEARHELDELFDCGDCVVAFVRFCTRSRGSGMEVVQREAHTWTFRDGKIVRFEWGRDLEGTLENARA